MSRYRFGTAAAALLAIGTARTSCHAFSSLTMSAVGAPKNIVVVGGGIQGTSVAYHIATSSSLPAGSKITVIEAKEPASAASGKGGGFMARSWGDGGNTQQLHHLAFDMYEELAKELGCTTYRKLPVLSVRPGFSGEGGAKKARKSAKLGPLVPSWLDGSVGPISALVGPLRILSFSISWPYVYNLFVSPLSSLSQYLLYNRLFRAMAMIQRR